MVGFDLLEVHVSVIQFIAKISSFKVCDFLLTCLKNNYANLFRSSRLT